MDYINISNFQIKINSFGFDNLLFKDTSLELTHPGIYVLNDENGKGKTTLLKLIANYYNFDGQILINNDVINDNNSYQDNYISYVNQEILIFEDKTALENVLLPYQIKNKDKAIEILNKFQLSNVINQNASTLSEGEKRRLYLARMFYDLKPILLLDEITTSLDSENCKIIINVLDELKKDHIILLVSHEKLELNNETSFIKINEQKILLIDNDINNKSLIKTNYHEFSTFKDMKNVFKFHPKFHALICFLIILFSSLMMTCFPIGNSFSFKSSLNSLSNYEKLRINTYLHNSPIFLIYQGKIDFDQEVTYQYQDFLWCFDEYSNEIGHCYAGLFLKNDYSTSNIELMIGTYPTKTDEVLISNYHYEILKTKYKLNDLSKEKYLFSDYKIADYYGNNHNIVGVYKGGDNIASYQKRIAKIKGTFYSNDVRSSYGFMIESLFGYSNETLTYSAIINNKETKKMIKGNEKLILPNVLQMYDQDLIMINDNGDFKLGFFNGYMSFILFFAVSFICLILLSFVIPIMHYQLYKDETIVLRYASLSRNRLIKAHYYNYILEIIFSVIIGFMLSLISIFACNIYISSNIIDSYLNYITINYVPFLSIIIFVIVFYLITLFEVKKILLNKNFSKQLIGIKRK